MFAPFCPKHPADLAFLSSLLGELTETTRGPLISAEILQGNCQIKVSLARGYSADCYCKNHLITPHTAVPDVTAWQVQMWNSLVSYPVTLPKLPCLVSSSEFPTYKHWTASWPTSTFFTMWAQPLISHHSLHPLLYSSLIELTFIPPNTPFLGLTAFARAVPSASNFLSFDQCLFNLQD